MGQFKNISIKDVISEINQSFFLKIQRHYIWLKSADDKKIEQLFDVILKGYPTGSFLFWKLKKSDIETNRVIHTEGDILYLHLYKFLESLDERSVPNEKINIKQVNSDYIHIILDGQQRLTSLYVGLKGSRTIKRKWGRIDNPNAYKEKKLYLNLRHHPSTENPEDNYEFEFLKSDEIPQQDNSNFWFKVGDILDMVSVISYVRENKLNVEEADMLEKLKEVFCTQKLISYYEETEKDFGTVLKNYPL